MGAWGPDTFENDAAGDWAYELEETKTLALVKKTLKAVAGSGGGDDEDDDEGDELDADAACEALAACEVIARLRGNFGQQDSYTETVDAWVKAHPQAPPPELVKLAHQAIDRVLAEGSELRELWDDSDEGAKWLKAVESLRKRVGKA